MNLPPPEHHLTMANEHQGGLASGVVFNKQIGKSQYEFFDVFFDWVPRWLLNKNLHSKLSWIIIKSLLAFLFSVVASIFPIVANGEICVRGGIWWNWNSARIERRRPVPLGRSFDHYDLDWAWSSESCMQRTNSDLSDNGMLAALKTENDTCKV